MLIKYNKPNLRGIGAITLKPGVNDIPAADWAEAHKLFGVGIKRMIDDGLIEICEDAKGDPLEAADLGKLNEKKAVALVRDTVDDRLLMQWHESEKRKAVVTAIEAQLERIAKAGEPAPKGQ